MHIVNFIISAFLLVSMTISSGAQSLVKFPYEAPPSDNYRNCAAILHNGKVLVNDYSPEGKCRLEMGMRGILTVATVSLSDEGTFPQENITFKVAVKNERTNTIWMYSDQPMQELELKDVLKKCEKGDRLIIMTTDQEFSLPHHEVELVWGC